MLRPQTTYYARVKAVTPAAESEYSNIVSVTTLPGIIDEPIIAPLAIVLDKIETTDTTAILYLRNLNDAVQEYRISLSQVADFSTTVLNQLVYKVGVNTSTSRLDDIESQVISLSGLSPGTLYYLRIQSVNNLGASAIYSQSITTKAILRSPVIIGTTSLTAIDATIEWCEVVGAVSYRLDISTSPVFTTFIVNNLNITDTSYTVTVLLENTTYYYRLRSVSSSSTSSNTDVESFTTLDGTNTYTGASLAINTPVLRGGVIAKTNSLAVYWRPVLNASLYEISISTSNSFTAPVTEILSATDFEFTGLNDATVYYVRLRAINNNLYSDYVYASSSTLSLDSFLSPPQLMPITSQYSTSIVVNWIKRTYATRYFIEVSTDVAFSNIIRSVSTGDFNSYRFESLNPSTQYYIRISGASSIAQSTTSAPLSVVTAASLSLPIGLVSSIKLNGVQLQWIANSIYNRYLLTVQRQTSSQAYEDVLDGLYTRLDVGASTNYLLDKFLQADTSYRWKITGVTVSGDEKESNFNFFTTQTLTPVLSLSPINQKLTWTGNLTNISVSTDTTFKSCIKGWSSRTLEASEVFSKAISVQKLIQSSANLYIRGEYQSPAGNLTTSSILYTGDLDVLVTKQSISTSTFQVEWRAGDRDSLSKKYAVRVESFVSGTWVPLAPYNYRTEIGEVNSFNLRNLLPNTNYRFYLSYEEAGRYKDIPMIEFTTNSLLDAFNLPTSSTLLAPIVAINYLTTDRVCLDVNAGASIVAIRVAQDANFKKVVYYAEISSGLHVVELPMPGKYYIEAVAFTLSNKSASTASLVAILPEALTTVLPITAVPTLSSVVVINSNEVAVSISNAPGATGFTIELSKDSSFTVLDREYSVVYEPGRALILGLLAGQLYYARVYAYNKTSITNYSQSIIIDTIS